MSFSLAGWVAGSGDPMQPCAVERGLDLEGGNLQNSGRDWSSLVKSEECICSSADLSRCCQALTQCTHVLMLSQR